MSANGGFVGCTDDSVLLDRRSWIDSRYCLVDWAVPLLGGLADKAKMRESDFQQQIIDLAHLNGWRVAHFRSVRQQRMDGSVFYSTPVQADGIGFPDLLMLRDERMVIVELKVENNKTSDAQDEWLDAFRNAGVEVYVWWPKDWDEAVKVLSRVR